MSQNTVMQCALKQKIRECRFVLIDLQLYLDTHPDDESAMQDYLCYAEKLKDLNSAYEESYGPLFNFGQSTTTAGSWVYDPWPWAM